jgi:V/A-type H+-transporting ATPase subunit I
MIEKMKKYSFVLYHKEYPDFLTKLQQLGMLHIIRSTNELSPALLENQDMLAKYAEAIKLLTKYQGEESKGSSNQPNLTLLNNINQAKDEKEALLRQIENLSKHIRDLEPWGAFDYEMLSKLRKSGISVEFYHCPRNHFKDEWASEYSVHKIGERVGITYFVVLASGEAPVIEADTFSFHEMSLQELIKERDSVNTRISEIDEYFVNISDFAIKAFQEEIARLTTAYDYADISDQALDEADGHLKVISGWIPVSKEEGLKAFIQEGGIIHVASEAEEQDDPPINLINNWFARLFEPITRMYMLPKYTEFDLTPLFAPFFMLFFGFCNADIAYGLVLLLIAFVLRMKIKNPAVKSYMGLVALFGGASIVMGWVMGSLLGFDLKEMATIGPTIPIRSKEQIFNFGLLLGAIQILFAVFITIVRNAVKNGFMHTLQPIGNFLIIGSLAIMGAGLLGTDISALSPYLTYILYTGLALVLLFNRPGRNPLKNVGFGLWELYNIISGFFGDILSYIRLFALGVSSSILGNVINSVGSEMLGITIIGPVVFVIFLILGHSLNLALSTLSGFVHPLRLTFIEFYGNAGFEGAGTEYKPFAKTTN